MNNKSKIILLLVLVYVVVFLSVLTLTVKKSVPSPVEEVMYTVPAGASTGNPFAEADDDLIAIRKHNLNMEIFIKDLDPLEAKIYSYEVAKGNDCTGSYCYGYGAVEVKAYVSKLRMAGFTDEQIEAMYLNK